MGGNPIQTICVWTRLANVGAIARSMRDEVIGLWPHADSAKAAATRTHRVMVNPYPAISRRQRLRNAIAKQKTREAALITVPSKTAP